MNSSEKLLKYLEENPLLLAPMAGVTDCPFRSFMKEMNCGIITTELISADALTRHCERTKRLTSFNPAQHPIGIQIFGESAETLSSAAQIVEQMGADFVDLNLGCPVPKIVKKGAGSAILKDLPKLGRILKSIKSKITIPLTIKIRTGWTDSCRNALETAHLAFNEGCLWTTLHGRTRSQGYSGSSDWNYIAQIARKAPLPIIGNGDLVDPVQIKNTYFHSHCQGLMIGRGCLKNPWIFNSAYELIFKKTLNTQSNKTILERLLFHLDSFYNEKMTLLQFKKFAVWFSAGYPQSAGFRKTVFQLKERTEVLHFTFNYFDKHQFCQKEPAVYEPFLMQGHG